MTDLKRALRAFDDLAPDEAILRRARNGPTRAASTGPSGGERLIAGLTAVAVFALAATFAWRILGGTDDPPPPGSENEVVELGADGSTLWPQRTGEELVRAQSRADVGDPPFPWQLDPDELVDRFAVDVLGWPLDTFAAEVDRSRESQGTLVAHLERTKETCPPYTPKDQARGLPRCFPGTEDVTLVQPQRVGEGGLWVVSAVRSPDLGVGLVPGQVIENGETVPVDARSDEDLNAAWATAIGGLGELGNCFVLSGGVLSASAGIEVRIQPDARGGTECGTRVHGYVVVSTATFIGARSRDDAIDADLGRDYAIDPLMGDRSPYVSVTAIPIVVSIPQNQPTPGTDVYEDPMGWKVDHPSGWVVSRASRESGARVWISNVEIFEGAPVESVVPPADAVTLSIVPVEREDPMQDDSSFPLSIFDFGSHREQGVFQLRFQGNGLPYDAQLVVGEGASDEDFARMGDVITSLRFQSIPPGEQMNGWLSLDVENLPEGRGVPIWAGGRFGYAYLVEASFGDYLLDLEPDMLDWCSAGGLLAWDEDRDQILLQCEDGTEVRYGSTGEPVADNPPRFTERLRAYPVIDAWNGSRLMSLEEMDSAQLDSPGA